jgi:multidrug resistance protein
MPDSWTSDGHTSAPARRRTGVPTILIGALTFLTPFSIDVSLAGLPTIARAIGAPGGLMQWTLAAFIFATGAGQLFWGPLSDRFGRRPIVIAGLALFTLSAFACSVANDVALLIALRFTQGLGASAGTVTAFAVITDLALPPDERTRRQALISSISNVGPLAAPIAGVWILSALGWRALYAVPALLGAAEICGHAAGTVSPCVRIAAHRVAGGGDLRALRRLFRDDQRLVVRARRATRRGDPVLRRRLRHRGVGGAARIVSRKPARPPDRRGTAARRGARDRGGGGRRERRHGCRLPVGTGVRRDDVGLRVRVRHRAAGGVLDPLAEAGPDAGVASGILGASISLGGAAGSAVDGILPFVASASTGAVVVVAAGASVIAYRRSLRER